MDSGKDMNLLT